MGLRRKERRGRRLKQSIKKKALKSLRQTKVIICTWGNHLDAQENILEWSEAVSRDGTLHNSNRVGSWGVETKQREEEQRKQPADGETKV